MIKHSHKQKRLRYILVTSSARRNYVSDIPVSQHAVKAAQVCRDYTIETLAQIGQLRLEHCVHFHLLCVGRIVSTTDATSQIGNLRDQLLRKTSGVLALTSVLALNQV